jgi:hypothetical protein
MPFGDGGPRFPTAPGSWGFGPHAAAYQHANNIPPPQPGTVMMANTMAFYNGFLFRTTTPTVTPPPTYGLAPPPANPAWFRNNFWRLGAANDVINKLNVNLSPRCLTPTQNYALAADALLRTIQLDMNAVKNSAILNSGATSHFLASTAPATNLVPTTEPIIAHLPNGEHVTPTHTCMLDIPALPAAACHAHIIPNLASHSLISVVTLCNAGCNLAFTKIGCTILYRGCTVLCANKCTRTGLWIIPLAATTPPPPTPTVTPADDLPTAIATNVKATSTAAEYAWFVHQALWFPPAATLLWALERSKELATIPSFSLRLVCNHLPLSTATNKGHMRRHRQGTGSTRSLQPAILDVRRQVDNLHPTKEICAAHNIFCFPALADLSTGTMYTNLPGAFQVCSTKSMQYVFVAYVYDLITILVHAMPSKNDGAMIDAFTEILATLPVRNYHLTLNVMDYECSKAVEVHIHNNKKDIHLSPPHNHWVNAAKRTIAAFKEHFIVGLTTVNKDCPLHLWDEFLPQVELMLNLLHFSCRDPSKSANKEVNGFFNYNKTPITPLGTKGLVYDDPTVRASWAPHGTNAYYVGLAPKHYCCMRFFVSATWQYCIANTWRIFPRHCATPTISPNNVTVLTACDVLRVLDGTLPAMAHNAITLQMAIHNLRTILSPSVPSDDAAPRVGVAPDPRVPVSPRDARVLCPTVSNDPAPPVLYPRDATTSINTTSCACIRGTRFVHQQVTHNNNLFAPLEDDDKPNDHEDDPNSNFTANDITIHADIHTVAPLPRPARPTPIQRTRTACIAPTTCTLCSAITPQVLRSGRTMLLPTQPLAMSPPTPHQPVI